MLSFAAICPHPPLLIPSIGGRDLAEIKDTVNAMNLLSDEIANRKIDTIVIISPHGSVFMDLMSVNTSEKLIGDFIDFGDETKMEFQNDVDFAAYIKDIADSNNIPVQTVNDSLDHGAMVPLYYLTQKMPNVRVVHISFSYLDYGKHFSFGEIIYEAAQNMDKNVAIIASGDLSHRLTADAPAGYSVRGKEFDKHIISSLNKNEVEKILDMDSRLVEDAGECGLRSIIILLGALSNVDYRFEKLSYEGPFGVGYLVGKFEF
ncbi:MAG: AmmeMemoRadiSam system protein B [Candidatus Pacebacteria bacterium]|nr:AmmeMemoRadiSam system protein B [Candidatus Paceibacterota bacterium]